MRKVLFLVALVIASSSLFNLKVKAFEASPNSGDYSSDTIVTINITALPQGTENAVSINLVAEGMEVQNYNPPSGEDWLSNTSDCPNNQAYATDKVCTSIAKTTAIVKGESLGTITVKIKGSTYATLTKTSESAYSDGKVLRKDTGVLAEFNKAKATTTPVTQPSSTDPNIQSSAVGIISSFQPILILIAVVVIIGLILLMLWPKIKTKLVRSQDTSSTPFQ